MKNRVLLAFLSSIILCNASEPSVSNERDIKYYDQIQRLLNQSNLDQKKANSLLLEIVGECSRLGYEECPLAVEKLLHTNLVDTQSKSQGLILAVTADHAKTTQLLLQSGALTETWSGDICDEKTPLGIACYRVAGNSRDKTLETIRTLIDAGVNVNAQFPSCTMFGSYRNPTPLDWIIKKNFSTNTACMAGTCNCHCAQATALLLKAGADVTILNTPCCTLLKPKNEGYRCKKTDDLIEKAYEDHLDRSIGQDHGNITTCSIQ